MHRSSIALCTSIALKSAIALTASLAITSPAHAGQTSTCPTEPWELIVPAGLSTLDQYGYAIATLDDWLFVGAPMMDDPPQIDAGAVFIYQLDRGIYEFRQKLLPTAGSGPAHFGFSIAAHGNLLIVGAENDREITQSNPNAWGAAYIFKLQDNLWILQQKLFAFGPGDPSQHGWAVDIHNDLAAVGIRQLLNDGDVNFKGAACTYRFNGTTWINEQRLTSDTPSQLDRFGTALVLTADTLLIGASQDNSHSTAAGVVFVFTRDGESWIQTDKLYAPDASPGDRFGAQLAVDADSLIIAAPDEDDAGANAGAAYIFQWNGANWLPAGKLLPDAGTFGNFGASIAVSGDRLLIGAPGTTLGFDLRMGAAYIFRRVDDVWTPDRRLMTQRDESSWGYGHFNCWQQSPQPADWSVDMWQMQLGLSAAISPIGWLLGSGHAKSKCWDYDGPEFSGGVNLFADQYVFPDCNLNGIHDVCDAEPDCNGNFVPDSCEFADQTASDCNSNSTPDECETGTLYFLNTGPANAAFSVSSATGNADFIWLNQYRVKSGGQVLTHIAISSTPFLPHGTPISVLVYADPNQDGDPSDAQLLASAETTALAFDGNPEVRLLYVKLPPTYLGEPGTFFFVGAVVHTLYLNSASLAWATAATAGGIYPYKRSWRAFAPPGQADIHDLTNNASPVQLWSSDPFVLRGVASDCNGNGAWDACEIANGEVADVNGNGIPDSCEVPDCFFADLAPARGDGEVNVLDLLYVLTNWGVCNPCYAVCPGDINEDCATNVLDLLGILQAWGACK